jgi:hypothetical protein
MTPLKISGSISIHSRKQKWEPMEELTTANLLTLKKVAASTVNYEARLVLQGLGLMNTLGEDVTF